MRWSLLLVICCIASVARTRAEEPRAGEASAPAAPNAVAAGNETAVSNAVAATNALGPARPATLSVLGGAGLYESLHVGVEYHTSGKNGFELFIGSNLGIPEAKVNTLGLSWRHDLTWKGLGLDPSILVRVLYWTSKDELYEWKLLSAIVGGTLSKELVPGTTIAFDVAAVRTFTSESNRLQNQSFGSPTEWNATLCISVIHVLKAW